MIALGYYEHYKGKMYLLIGIAQSSENSDEFAAIYIPLYPHQGAGIMFRPLDMFMETVEHEGRTVPRFKYRGQVAVAPVGSDRDDPPIAYSESIHGNHE